MPARAGFVFNNDIMRVSAFERNLDKGSSPF